MATKVPAGGGPMPAGNLPALAGHHAGVVGNALAGHAPGPWGVGKNNWPNGFPSTSGTTSGASYALGRVPD